MKYNDINYHVLPHIPHPPKRLNFNINAKRNYTLSEHSQNLPLSIALKSELYVVALPHVLHPPHSKSSAKGKLLTLSLLCTPILAHISCPLAQSKTCNTNFVLA